MKTVKILMSIAAGVLMTAACTDLKNEKLQVESYKTPLKDNAFDEEYYENLRAWKASDHTVSYVYFAAWAPPEGSQSLYVDYYNDMHNRFLGLPDSLDIVNLWMGAPSPYPEDAYDYSPHAWEELQYCRRVKGTKFVLHADASNYNHTFELEDEETGEVKTWKTSRGNAESIEAFAEWYCRKIIRYELDGIDWDFEGWSASDMYTAIKKSGEYFGPKANYDLHDDADEDKLNIIDYFGGAPGSNVEPYINYLVKQAYSAQGASGWGGPGWLPAKKAIACEQYEQNSGDGPNYKNGGYPTSRTNARGKKMYTLESYAIDAHNGTGGKGGGFGAYYIDNDYYNNGSNIGDGGRFETWYYLRNAIQAIYPAKTDE